MIKVLGTLYSKLLTERTLLASNISSMVLHFSSSKSKFSKSAADISEKKRMFHVFWKNKTPLRKGLTATTK
jgi:hypothetical protein